MSKIQTNKIQHTATGAAEFTLPTTDGTNGQVIKTNGSGVLSFGADIGGKLLQYSILSKNTKSSITGTTPTLIPDFSITITPTASNSIMVVKANMMCSMQTHVILFRIQNGTNMLIQPATFDSHDDGTGAWYGSGDRMTNQHVTAFETSGNTNARTYNVYWNVTGGTGWINRYQGNDSYNSTSNLEVMEVAP